MAGQPIPPGPRTPPQLHKGLFNRRPYEGKPMGNSESPTWMSQKRKLGSMVIGLMGYNCYKPKCIPFIRGKHPMTFPKPRLSRRFPKGIPDSPTPARARSWLAPLAPGRPASSVEAPRRPWPPSDRRSRAPGGCPKLNGGVGWFGGYFWWVCFGWLVGLGGLFVVVN